MRLYLIGYMFSGKSTIGMHLANRMGYDFVDLDDIIEERYHFSVSDLFKRYGETAFRKLETSALTSTGMMNDAVIACGGGTPCYNDNMQFILQHGYCVYLKLRVDDVMQRYERSHRKHQRPLLHDLSPEEMRQYIETQLAVREKYYSQASLIIDAFHAPLQIVNGIVAWASGHKE